VIFRKRIDALRLALRPQRNRAFERYGSVRAIPSYDTEKKVIGDGRRQGFFEEFLEKGATWSNIHPNGDDDGRMLDPPFRASHTVPRC